MGCEPEMIDCGSNVLTVAVLFGVRLPIWALMSPDQQFLVASSHLQFGMNLFTTADDFVMKL